MTDLQETRDLLLLIVASVVEHPGQLALETIRTEHSTTFRLRVADDDLGKVIGRSGRFARSLRTFLIAVGLHSQRTLFLDIVKPAQAGEEKGALSHPDWLAGDELGEATSAK